MSVTLRVLLLTAALAAAWVVISVFFGGSSAHAETPGALAERLPASAPATSGSVVAPVATAAQPPVSSVTVTVTRPVDEVSRPVTAIVAPPVATVVHRAAAAAPTLTRAVVADTPSLARTVVSSVPALPAVVPAAVTAPVALHAPSVVLPSTSGASGESASATAVPPDRSVLAAAHDVWLRAETTTGDASAVGLPGAPASVPTAPALPALPLSGGAASQSIGGGHDPLPSLFATVDAAPPLPTVSTWLLGYGLGIPPAAPTYDSDTTPD